METINFGDIEIESISDDGNELQEVNESGIAKLDNGSAVTLYRKSLFLRYENVEVYNVFKASEKYNELTGGNFDLIFNGPVREENANVLREIYFEFCHDLVVYLVCQRKGLSDEYVFSKDKKFLEILDETDYLKENRKTLDVSPDLLRVEDGTIKWCEVGVSDRTDLYEAYKKDKYKKAKTILMFNYEVLDEYLIVNRDLESINLLLNNIEGVNMVDENLISQVRYMINKATNLYFAVKREFHLKQKGFNFQDDQNVFPQSLTNAISECLAKESSYKEFADFPDIEKSQDNLNSMIDGLAKRIREDPDLIDSYKDTINTKEKVESVKERMYKDVSKIHEGYEYVDEPRPSLHMCYFEYPECLETETLNDIPVETNFILQMFDYISMAEVPDDQESASKLRYVLDVLGAMCLDGQYKDRFDNPDLLDRTKFYVLDNSKKCDERVKEITDVLDNIDISKDRLDLVEMLNRKKADIISKKPLKFSKYSIYRRLKNDKSHMCGNNFVKFRYSSSGRIFESKGSGGEKLKREIGRNKISLKLEKRFENDVESFINWLSNTSKYSMLSSYLTKSYKHDRGLFGDLIDEYNEDNNKILALIQRTRCFQFNLFIKRWSRNLMHYGGEFCNKGKAHIFTSGRRGHITILGPGSSIAKTGGIRPFMQAFIVDKGVKVPLIYGRGIDRYNINDKCDLLITNWRSLESFKVYHIVNSHTAVLGCAVDALSRHICDMDRRMLLKENHTSDRCGNLTETKLAQFYCLPSIISMCTSYETCRILGDSRYLVMNSTAWLSNYESFVIDKYKPPYKSCIDVFLVRRLLSSCVDAVDHSKNFKVRVPNFVDGIRQQSSVGGFISMPSIYIKNASIKSMQDLLFEMFLSVLTPKESSSLYHKYIEAVNTMKEFQNNFEKEMVFRKGFTHEDPVDYAINLLKSKPKVGFSSHFTYVGCRLYGKKLNKHKISSDVGKFNFYDSIGGIATTKGSVDSNTSQKPQNEKKIVNTEINAGKDDLEKTRVHINFMRRIKENKEKGKDFSHLDAMLEFFTPGFISNIAIAIKAQYGSKREFYIQDELTRIALNYLENHVYKPICSADDVESITIRGDNKLIDLERLQNNCCRIIARSRNDIKYGITNINGDCSKWSARCCLGEFLALNEALLDEGILSEDIYKLCKCIFLRWTQKEIQVPPIVIQNLTEDAMKKFKYGEGTGRVDRIKLNSNFLQGFFNYSSSAKHSACVRFSKVLFDKVYPERSRHLRIFPRVHSDDYTVVVLHEKPSDLIKYRCIEKMCMVLFGIQDSDKKTNVHAHFQEFVSLFLFNTSLHYPTIKVAKDVGLSVPCTGYKDDMFASISHSINYVRRGGCMSVSYMLQRLSNMAISESYSINEYLVVNGTKYFREDLPIEMGGISNTHPVLYLFSGSSANNYRLYVENKNRRLLWSLLQENNLDLGGNLDDLQKSIDERTYTNLYSPKYTYVFDNDIKEFREEFPVEDGFCDKFWKEHPCYLFLKPVDHEMVYNVMLCRLYSEQFSIAFSRQSRVALTLRLSYFAKRRCIKFKDGLVTTEEYMLNMIERSWKYSEDEINHEYLQRMLCNSNSLLPSLNHISRTSYLGTSTMQKTFLRAEKVGRSYKTMNFSMPIEKLLQYVFYPKDYKLDKRSDPSYVLLSNSQELIRNFPREYNEIKTRIEIGNHSEASDRIANLYKLLSLTQKSKLILLTPCRKDSNMHQVLKETLAKMSIYGKKYEILLTETTEILNPLDFSESFSYRFESIIDQNKEFLNNIQQIFIYLYITCKMSPVEINDVLRNIRLHASSGVLTYLQKLEEITTNDIWNINKRKTITNIAIMKKVLLGQNGMLSKCLKSLRPYLYKYEVVNGIVKDGGMQSKSLYNHVFVRHSNTNFEAIHGKDGSFVVYCDDTTDHFALKNGYIISRMLCGLTRDYSYEFDVIHEMSLDDPRLIKNPDDKSSRQMSPLETSKHLFRISGSGGVTYQSEGRLRGLDLLKFKSMIDEDFGNIDIDNEFALPVVEELTLKVKMNNSTGFGWSGSHFPTSTVFTTDRFFENGILRRKEVELLTLLNLNAISKILNRESIILNDKAFNIIQQDKLIKSGLEKNINLAEIKKKIENSDTIVEYTQVTEAFDMDFTSISFDDADSLASISDEAVDMMTPGRQYSELDKTMEFQVEESYISADEYRIQVQEVKVRQLDRLNKVGELDSYKLVKSMNIHPKFIPLNKDELIIGYIISRRDIGKELLNYCKDSFQESCYICIWEMFSYLTKDFDIYKSRDVSDLGVMYSISELKGSIAFLLSKGKEDISNLTEFGNLVLFDILSSAGKVILGPDLNW